MIKRLSRIFVILTLILTLSFSLVACGGNEEETPAGEQALPYATKLKPYHAF